MQSKTNIIKHVVEYDRMFKPLHVVYCPICKQFLVKFAWRRSFSVMWAEVDDRWEQIWANWIQPNLWSTITPDVHFYALWIYVKSLGILFFQRNLLHNSSLSAPFLSQPLCCFAPFVPTLTVQGNLCKLTGTTHDLKRRRGWRGKIGKNGGKQLWYHQQW